MTKMSNGIRPMLKGVPVDGEGALGSEARAEEKRPTACDQAFGHQMGVGSFL